MTSPTTKVSLPPILDEKAACLGVLVRVPAFLSPLFWAYRPTILSRSGSWPEFRVSPHIPVPPCLAVCRAVPDEECHKNIRGVMD